MRIRPSLLALVCSGTTCATAFAQDSVSKLSALPGDAVDAYTLNEQVNDYVVDLATFTSSWGKTFGIAPVVKFSAERTTAPTFFTAAQGAQAISKLTKTGVPFLRSAYSYWNQPGFGVNDDVARNDPGTLIPTTGFVGYQFALAAAEFSAGNPTAVNLRNVVGGVVNFTDEVPSRLYVSRVVAAQNAPAETCSLASFGMGSVDEDGNVAVRVDGNSTSAAGCGGTVIGVAPNDENLFAIDMTARSTATTNVISEVFPAGGGDAAAAQRVWTNSFDTVNTPNLVPESVAGRRIVLSTNFTVTQLLSETSAGVVTAAATGGHLAAGVVDHRGALGYTPHNFPAVFPGAVTGTAGQVAKDGGALTSYLNLFGLDANGNSVAPKGLLLPAVMTDPAQPTWSNTNVAGVQQFDHYHGATAFQGGSSQVALGRDQAGNLLAAGVVYYGAPTISTPYTQPNNYIAVARVNPVTGVPTWSVAAWTQEGGTAVSDGKTIFQNGTTPIGRLRAFIPPPPALPSGPTMSPPMFDAVGNVWFTGAYELTSAPGTILVGVFRAVLDPGTFSYRLELVLARDAVFAGRNSGKNYKVTFLTLNAATSISSSTTFSGNMSGASYKNLSTVGMATDDARTLGGVVIGATIVYDMNADGLYLAPASNPGSPDEDYRVMLYLTAATDCNANGIADDVEIEDGLVGDTNANGIPDPCEGIIGTLYCSGDGVAIACPCGNNSVAADKVGCLSSLGVGGKLRAGGVATVGADTVVLTGSQVPNGPGLYFQGTTQLGGGNGILFGDGLRCVGGQIIRLGIVAAAGNTSNYPTATAPNNVPVSIKGLVPPGSTRNYQLWYRDSASFCTAAVFNLTNGLQLVWN